MPFKKTGEDTYTSPSGRHFNGAQVRLYYSNGGKFPGQKTKEAPVARAKSYGTFNAGYAAGGPVLGRTRDFMKEPDAFRSSGAPNPNYADGKKEQGKSKCLPPVKPQK